jgi:hypothetical protein
VGRPATPVASGCILIFQLQSPPPGRIWRLEQDSARISAYRFKRTTSCGRRYLYSSAVQVSIASVPRFVLHKRLINIHSGCTRAKPLTSMPPRGNNKPKPPQSSLAAGSHPQLPAAHSMSTVLDLTRTPQLLPWRRSASSRQQRSGGVWLSKYQHAPQTISLSKRKPLSDSKPCSYTLEGG